MHTATQSSPNYDFRKDFDSIARPSLIRYLKHLGYGVDLDDGDDPNDFDDAYYTGAKQYSRRLWKALMEAQEFCELGLAAPCNPKITTWTRESAVALTNERLDEMIACDEPDPKPEPVDIDRSVRLGTEMARKRNSGGKLPFQIDIGPEAIAYAADRLKSKIERGAVHNPITEVHSGLLSYRFLKEMNDGGKVINLDRYRQLQSNPEPGGAEQEAEAEAPDPKPEVGAQKRGALLLSAWLKLDIPPRDFLLGELLSTTSRWIVYGETGIGKTLWALDLAAAIAAGEGFLHWDGSGKRRRVMYLDGELPAETFKERLQIIAQRYGHDLELYAYNRDVLSDGEMPPLNTPAGEKWLWREIDGVKPDVIVSDSIMCLLEGSMSEEDSWAPIKAMICKISGRRIAQIWLHHTGHDTSKGFGTKTREWEMDTVVSLTDDDGSILMEFKKARLRKPETREQFEPKKIVCNADGWAIVGDATKRRGPKSDESASLKRQILAAYERLADGADTMPGLNGKPVKKVPVERLRDEVRNRGFLAAADDGNITVAGRKAFQRAKEALLTDSTLIEKGLLIWK